MGSETIFPLEKASRILVTGASGLLGRALVLRLRRDYPSAQVIGLARKPVSGLCGESILLDMTDVGKLCDVVPSVDVVFHLAANIPRPPLGDQSQLLWDNLRLAEAVRAACLKWQPQRLINASSISVYHIDGSTSLKEDQLPAPDSHYGIGKLAGEHLLALSGIAKLGVVSLRMSSLYGPGMASLSVLPIFMERARQGQALCLYGKGERTQDFLHVDDACTGMIRAAESARPGSYNLACGIDVSMVELAHTVAALPGWRVDVRHLDRIDHSPSVRVDISLAKQAFGYQGGRTLAEGLAEMQARLDELSEKE
ncbi:MAG: NAD(P)-dependent oxidoreductase [Alphaproteobacteria bacterium]|nr:NAD(P)-dependent oxidoreductase [Alphaproteobacteria bacterium]